MRQGRDGQYVETLGDSKEPVNKDSSGASSNAQQHKRHYKVGDTRPPTVLEVMLDPDFLTELRSGNEELGKFLTNERMLKVADFVTLEP